MLQAAAIFTCCFFVGLLLWAEYRSLTALKWIAKPGASAAFVLTALAAGAGDSAYGLWVLAALISCMAGDILLIPKVESTFLAGMAAFAAGHGAYIGAFLSGAAAVTPLFLAGAVLMAIFAGLSLRWLWPHLGDFRAPVSIYSVIIALMVAVSFLAAPPESPAPNLLVIAGAIGFAISDISVAKDKFVAPQFANKAWGLPLYYAAQLLLATSI